MTVAQGETVGFFSPIPIAGANPQLWFSTTSRRGTPASVHLAAGVTLLARVGVPSDALETRTSQQGELLYGAVTDPAWKTKPSWHLISTDDKMIPPDAQRAMSKRAASTVVEAKGSHAVYVSQPRVVADLIAKAANAVALADGVVDSDDSSD